MRRRKPPLERFEIAETEVRTRVSAVLTVLAGEKSIREVCDETGIPLLHYYKLEEKMIAAMIHAARLPDGRRSRRDAMTQATDLVRQTETLRQEHRRMQCLVRISRKLLRMTRGPRRAKATRKGAGKTLPKADGTPHRTPRVPPASNEPGPEKKD